MWTKNLKLFVFFAIAIGISLLFLKPIISLLVGIGEFIDCQSPNFIIGFAVLSLILIVGYLSLIYNRFVQSKRFSIFLMYCTAIYIILRFFFSHLISFEPVNDEFKYADLLIIVSILHLLSFIIVEVKFSDSNNRKKNQLDSFFIEDGIFKSDEIDNEQILQKLINSLIDFKPSVAFSIGLNAVWGYGKSSFLEKFKNDYQQKQPRTIIFWNRIWKNKGSIAIIENFFEELKDNLKPYSAEISGDINNYVNSILSLSSSDLQKFISAGQSAFSENATLEKFYNGINSSIKKIDRQVIILLDDLDRLEKHEIMDTLKLIRTLSDFNNIIFIAGYDRKYIVDTIESAGQNYLDKIFNVEINLLPFDEQLIIDELIRQVDLTFPKIQNSVDEIDFNTAFKSLFLSDPIIPNIDTVIEDNGSCTKRNLKYQDFLKTYRDVKRFFNEFKFNAGFLDSEFDVIGKEYILLKLLIYRFRDLNNVLFADLNKFLSRGILDEVNNRLQFNRGFDENSTVYVYNEASKKRTETLLENFKYSDDEIEVINAVLCILFGEKSTDFYNRNQNSITKIYYTDVYIRNNIAGGKISLTTLQDAYLTSSLIKIAKDIINSPSSNFQISNELKQFIFNNKSETKDQYLDSLRAIDILLQYSTVVDDQKVIDILREGFHKYFDKNKSSFLSEIFKIIKYERVGYLDRLLSTINLNLKRQESKLNYDESIKRFKNNEFDTQDIKRIYLDKLNFLIEKQSNPNIIFTFYNLHVEKIVGDKQIVHASEFNSLIRKNIESRFLDYFNSPMFDSLREGIDENTGQFVGYAPNFVLAQIFSNFDNLLDVIKNPTDKNLYDNFYKEGWRNFQNYIMGQDFSEIDDKTTREKLDFMKRFVEGYIQNGCKPLSRIKYNEIKENLPY